MTTLSSILPPISLASASGTLPVGNGGTGVTTSTGTGSLVLSQGPVITLTNATGLPLATGVTGALAVGNGGTGAETLAANNVLIGNGTSAVQEVAPGTLGNLLTSDGTTWTSAAAPASGLQQFTSSGSIAAGQPVSLNSNGTVSVVAGTSTSQSTLFQSPVGSASQIGPRLGNTFYDAEIDRTLRITADSDNNVAASSYRVGEDGSITSTGAGVFLGSVNNPNSVPSWTIVKTGTGRYAFVYSFNNSFSQIRGITVNTSTGAVSNLWTASVSVAGANSVVDATFDDASGRLIVVARTNDSVVTLFAYNPQTGSQTASLQVTSSTSNQRFAVAVASNTNISGQFLVLVAQGTFGSQMRSFVGNINSAGTTFTAGSQINSITGFNIEQAVISLTYVSNIDRYIALHSNSGGSFRPEIHILGVSGSVVASGSIQFPNSRQVIRFNSGCIDATNSEIRVVGAGSFANTSLQYATRKFSASALGLTTFSQPFPVAATYSGGGAIYTPTAYQSFFTAFARSDNTASFNVVAFTIESFFSNAQNFTGFATNTVTTGQSAIVAVPGGVAVSQTGLTRNLEFYLNFDGSLITDATPFGVVLRATSSTEGGVIRPVNALRPLGRVSVTSGIAMSLPLGEAGFRVLQCNYTVNLASSSTAALILSLSNGQTVTLTFVGLQVTGANQVSNTEFSSLGPGFNSTYSGSLTADRTGGGTFTGRYGANSFSGQITPGGFAPTAAITKITLQTGAAITSGSLTVYGIPA